MHIQTLKAACDALGIEEHERKHLSCSIVKRQYRKYALKYHPDKNHSPDAVDVFHEIQEAQEFLLKHLKQNHCELDAENDEPRHSPRNHDYKSIFVNFIGHLFKGNNKLTLILSKLAGLCETAALEYLRKIEKPMLAKIYEVARQQNDVFHFSDEFLDAIREILEEKEKNEEVVILNPYLDDLLKDQLYKLTHHGQLFIIPLWHTELVYDISGCDFVVKCCPVLPENMELDEHNNLEVDLYYNVADLWDREKVDVYLGNKTVCFHPKQLRFVPYQSVVLKGEGILAIHSKNIYDVSVRRDVILNIYIYL